MAEGPEDRVSLATDEQPDASRHLSDSTIGSIASKACCVCGADLHGRTRYKDTQGRYWCPTCNENDQLRKQPATCPDCNQPFTRADLIEFKGTPVCHTCWERRRLASKREESRIRAVEEAAKEEVETRRRWLMIAASVVVILLIWGGLMLVYWWMMC